MSHTCPVSPTGLGLMSETSCVSTTIYSWVWPRASTYCTSHGQGGSSSSPSYKEMGQKQSPVCSPTPPALSPPVGKASGPVNSTDESKRSGSALRQLRHMQAAPQMARKPEAFDMSELSPLTHSIPCLMVPYSCHTRSHSKPVGRHHDPVHRQGH